MPDAVDDCTIVHIFRAPVGGLFRHVCDLAERQIALGLDVGLICDSLTGGAEADARLARLAPGLRLGIHRLPMRRDPHPGDLAALRLVMQHVTAARVGILHGHGSKGGLYARLIRRFGGGAALAVYTPHGGSLNYHPGSLRHRLYMGVERLLERWTDLFLFESRFIADRFRTYVTDTDRMSRIVLNGLHAAEFEPRRCLDTASDLLFIGELREAKGIDILMDALLLLRGQGLTPTLTLVGRGPDESMLRARADAAGLDRQITFAGSMPARDAFRRGRIMVVPSRFESMPYVVLEAAAAAVPLIVTPVGGVPEIVGADYEAAVPAGDAGRLASCLARDLARPPADLDRRAAGLSDAIRPHFNVERMGDEIVSAYREALSQRAARRASA